MFGSRWLRFKWNCTRLMYVFFFTVMTTGMATGILQNIRPSDDAARVLATIPLSALLWIWAFLLGRLFSGSLDAFFFGHTPMTPRIFVRRHLRNHWMVYAYGFVVLPWTTCWFVRVGIERPIDPLIVAAAFLAYYAILLGPLAENVSESWAPTRLLFVPRHLLRFGLVPAAIIGAIAGGGFLLARDQTIDALRSAATALLDLDLAGIAIITITSPASGVAALAETGASHTALITLCMAFGLLILWEIQTIERSVFASPRQYEQHTLDAWLKQRKQWLEGMEDAADEEHAAVEEWQESRSTYAADTAAEPREDGHLAYDETISPERQLLRHAVDVRESVPIGGIAGALRAARRRLWPLAIPLLYSLSYGMGELPRTAIGLAVVGCMWYVFRASAVGASWTVGEPILRLNVTVPVRLTRLMPLMLAKGWIVGALWDAVAAAACAKFGGAPLWSMVPLIVLLQFARISGGVRLWWALTRRKGLKQDLSFYQCLEMLVLFVASVAFIMDATDNVERDLISDPRNYAVILASAAGLIFFGLLTIAWRHRRADSSLPRNILARWGE